MSASLFNAELRRTYAAQRGVSQGAAITLAAASGGYQARFECAQRCAEILGDRHLDGTLLLIPTEEVCRSIEKLNERYSIALLDTVTDEKGTRFVLIWRVPPRTSTAQVAVQPLEVNIDDF